MTKLLISVVIPVWNAQRDLDRCLEALAMQSFNQEKFEVIVVDNGSTPPVRRSPSRPRQLSVFSEVQPGSYAARNTGVRAAKGDIIAFTDADCVPDRDWLERGFASIGKFGQLRAVGGGIQMFIPPGSARTPSALYDLCFGFRQERNLQHRGFLVTANLFIHRTALEVVGPFRTDIFSGGDVEWCARAMQHDVCLEYVPDAVVCHPVRTDWRALRSKVVRVGAGAADGRYRNAVKSYGSRKSAVFSKMAQINQVVKSNDLRTWRERVAVFLMAMIVIVWGVEGRVRNRLQMRVPR